MDNEVSVCSPYAVIKNCHIPFHSLTFLGCICMNEAFLREYSHCTLKLLLFCANASLTPLWTLVLGQQFSRYSV